MGDWSQELDTALRSGDPAFMRAMLARVPPEVLRRAIPLLDAMAAQCERDGRLDDALAYREQLVLAQPDAAAPVADRARVLGKLGRHDAVLRDAERIVTLAPNDALAHRLRAEARMALGDRKAALAAWREVLRLMPDDEAAKRAARTLEEELRKEAILRRALDPEAPLEDADAGALAPAPVLFDPALFDDPGLPSTSEPFRVEGLRQHLQRYCAQVSPRQAIARLEDADWLSAWDEALAGTVGSRVLFDGSELGVFALRALHHGAAHALGVESHALDARIAAGIVRKHFLRGWHARHGAAIQDWSEDERRESFEAHARGIDITGPEEGAAAMVADYRPDVFVFPRIDHSLLGTGIVRAVRRFRELTGASPRVLPARATVFAQAIQWTHPGSFLLDAIDRLRWSPYPQALGLGAESWVALGEPIELGDVDFADFEAGCWHRALPIARAGRVDAVLYWFELELGTARLSNAPGTASAWLRPAVQYTDPIVVEAGGALELRVQLEETRLHLHTVPPARLPKSRGLPGWYIAMLDDAPRNEAYRAALSRTLADTGAELALDIGAGCGLLSMMAIEAGAQRVVGCEHDPIILQAGRETIACNGFADRVVLVGKDCRQLSLPDDLSRRADLALFELFDCSLIGEGILHFLAHARAQLLSEDARYLPAAARIHAQLIEYRIDRVWDVEANLFNPYRTSPSFAQVDAAKLDYRALSEPVEVFAFDFAVAGPEPQENRLRLQAIESGMAGAVLFWFDLTLDACGRLSNAPGSRLHWKQGLQALPEVRVDAGVELSLLARHDGSALKFQWQPDGVPPDATSSLPRWDPRWLAASAALERQTQALLQHCARDPDERAKVAALAQRFAVDPAAHGLDPGIAQRFLSMFQ